MLLHINGEQRDLPDGLTVAALVAQLGMKPDRVAVELNLAIVPRPAWDATTLKSGDKLEVVHFVGGGSGTEISRSLQNEGSDTVTAEPATPQPWTCATCGDTGSGAFCPRCGEKRPSRHDLSIHHFFTHALGEFFHFDSKIFRTFRLLFTRPGFLASEYVRGCRKPYLHPFQVFFIANLIYFFLQPLTGWSGLRTPLYVHLRMMPYSALALRLATHRIHAKGVTVQQFSDAFNHVIEGEARSLVILMVPLLALLLATVQWRRRRFFGEHLVFALHFTAFWLIGMFVLLYGVSAIALRGLAHYGINFTDRQVDGFLFQLTRPIQGIYLYFAFRAFYRDSILAAALKAAGVAYLLLYIMQLYRFILFLTALWTS